MQQSYAIVQDIAELYSHSQIVLFYLYVGSEGDHEAYTTAGSIIGLFIIAILVVVIVIFIRRRRYETFFFSAYYHECLFPLNL